MKVLKSLFERLEERLFERSSLHHGTASPPAPPGPGDSFMLLSQSLSHWDRLVKIVPSSPSSPVSPVPRPVPPCPLSPVPPLSPRPPCTPPPEDALIFIGRLSGQGRSKTPTSETDGEQGCLPASRHSHSSNQQPTPEPSDQSEEPSGTRAGQSQSRDTVVTNTQPGCNEEQKRKHVETTEEMI
ncbi:unnamed protein product [Pleuronectes platessa]|uniref:Uncharacterized protein n=1 Tax=Pleuronectes platessa TaxID=8262 RepID=A0A9N7YDG6_PLEPL|nr:unnamed protein product [Pleuronectes platessa]